MWHEARPEVCYQGLRWSSCMKLKWPSHKLGHLYLPVMSRNKKPRATTPCRPRPPPARPGRTNGTQTVLAIAANIKCEMGNGKWDEGKMGNVPRGSRCPVQCGSGGGQGQGVNPSKWSFGIQVTARIKVKAKTNPSRSSCPSLSLPPPSHMNDRPFQYLNISGPLAHDAAPTKWP